MEYLAYPEKRRKESGKTVPSFPYINAKVLLVQRRNDLAVSPPSLIPNQSGPRRPVSLLSPVYKRGRFLTLLHDVTYFKQ